MTIRPVTEVDFSEIIRINTESEQFLNSQASLTVSELRKLSAIATGIDQSTGPSVAMKLFHSRRDMGQAATASLVTRCDRAM